MKNTDGFSRKQGILPFICVSCLIFLICRRSWVGDDAFITLRTVDNFVNGYGLTWNISERVQSYTHPLWMFLLTSIYFFSREPFYTTLSLNIILSFCSLIFLFRRFSTDRNSIILVTIALFFSRSFIDYSTSGLENALSHLIIAVYFYSYLKIQRNLSPKNIINLSLIASFGILNRMDLALVFAPSLIHLLIKKPRTSTLAYIIIGQIPFILWEIFSLIYYGFPFPNTAYAKLSSSISKRTLLEQGVTYFLHSAINDPITIFFIFFSIVIGLNAKDSKSIPIIVGGILYLLYVIWIGGDFMEGRFLTVPLFICCIVYLISSKSNKPFNLFFSIILFIFGLCIPYNTLTLYETNNNFSSSGIAENGIGDQRFLYMNGLGLLSRYSNHMNPEFEWMSQGKDFKSRNIRVTHCHAIGMIGYYSGPYVHIIDGFALADPLLSRLPIEFPVDWRIGHFARQVPDGYRESLEQDENLIVDPSIHEYYEKIRIITRGKIFTQERFKTIIEINVGKYDYLINNIE